MRSIRYGLIGFVIAAVLVAGLVTPLRRFVLDQPTNIRLLLALTPVILALPFGALVGWMAHRHDLGLGGSLRAALRTLVGRGPGRTPEGR